VRRQEAASRPAHVASRSRRGRSSTTTGTGTTYFPFQLICSPVSDDFLSAGIGGGAEAGLRRFPSPSVIRLVYKGAFFCWVSLGNLLANLHGFNPAEDAYLIKSSSFHLFVSTLVPAI